MPCSLLSLLLNPFLAQVKVCYKQLRKQLEGQLLEFDARGVANLLHAAAKLGCCDPNLRAQVNTHDTHTCYREPVIFSTTTAPSTRAYVSQLRITAQVMAGWVAQQVHGSTLQLSWC
jgi:hypothetical protein